MAKRIAKKNNGFGATRRQHVTQTRVWEQHAPKRYKNKKAMDWERVGAITLQKQWGRNSEAPKSLQNHNGF